MTARESVKLTAAALDDWQNTIVLRGVLSPEGLTTLKVGSYQREILPVSKIKDLVEAFNAGSVPDVDLGMRGGNFIEKDGCFYLQDDVYIIDGLQRITAAKEVVRGGKVPRLGAIVHFNTTEDWERNRFRILNTMNTKLSPNVLIRNMSDEYEFVSMILSLTKDKSFIMANKVCWNQRMKRDELISGYTLLKAASMLHSRFGPTRSMRFMDMIPGMQKVQDKIGRLNVRENIKTFWDLVDDCFKVKSVTFKDGAIALRGGFLICLASILSEHSNFWRDSKLFVERDLRKKISLFPINDPEIVRLAGNSSGASGDILYQLFIRHINSGKRTKKLIPSRKNIKKESAVLTQGD